MSEFKVLTTNLQVNEKGKIIFPYLHSKTELKEVTRDKK